MKKFYEDLGAEEGGLAQKARVLSSKLNQRLQVLLDKSTPKPVERWLALAALVFIYFVRVSRRRPGPGPDPHDCALPPGLTRFLPSSRPPALLPPDPPIANRLPAQVFVLQGFYIVTYGLGIYNLNLLIGFISPQIDPETEGPALPTKSDQEFKPFVRRLPEFKFW